MVGTLRRRELGDAVLDRQFLDALVLLVAAPARQQSRRIVQAPGQVQSRCELVVGIDAVRFLVPAQSELPP